MILPEIVVPLPMKVSAGKAEHGLEGNIIGDNVKIHCSDCVAQWTTLADEVVLVSGVTIARDPHPRCTLSMRGPGVRCGARVGASATRLSRITGSEGALVSAGSSR
jgi:hypothetical protein